MKQEVIIFALFRHRHRAAVGLSFAVKKLKPKTCQAYKRFRVDGVEGREQNEKLRTELCHPTPYVQLLTFENSVTERISATSSVNTCN